jgi:hypothetical protein
MLQQGCWTKGHAEYDFQFFSDRKSSEIVENVGIMKNQTVSAPHRSELLTAAHGQELHDTAPAPKRG